MRFWNSWMPERKCSFLKLWRPLLQASSISTSAKAPWTKPAWEIRGGISLCISYITRMAPDFSLSIRSLKSPINTCLVIFSIYYGYLLARDIACIFDDTCAYLYPYYALYSIPFSLALLLFFLKRNWQQNGLLVLFSYSLGLYFVSFGIYLFKAAPYWSTDNRNRYEVIMDLRAEGKDAWPIASPGNYIEDPHIPFKQKNILPLTSI